MITIKEIAEIAGVSPTTVSNVLHGRTKKVSKDTLAKVQQVIEQSNYVSNMGARMLGNYGSKIIAVILTYNHRVGMNLMQDPFAGTIIGTIEQEISRRGYFMMLYTNPNVEECLHMALAWNIEGLILLGLGRTDYYTFRSRLDIPIVTIDTYFNQKDQEYINIGLQDFEGAQMMTEYLIRQGHKKIAFLSLNYMDDYIDDTRYGGYVEALKKNHIHVSAERQIVLSQRPLEREKTYTQLVKEKFYGNTALFFAADFLALEAMNIFHDLGLQIPEDISIAGFDNIQASSQCRPQLTTVQQDIAEKGRRSVEELMAMIKKKPAARTVNIELPVQLVIRDTVRNNS